MRIVALSGSLQEHSSNAALLNVARSLAPQGTSVVISDGVRSVPLFNPDLDRARPPAAVDRFRRDVAAANAILIASPEYAFGVPGALKNVLDWLVGSGELYATPVAIVAGSPRENGGVHVRSDLERTLRAQGADVVTSVTIAVPRRDGGRDLPVGGNAREAIAQVLRDLVQRVADTRAEP